MGAAAVAVEREVKATRARFVATIFIGSFLLFLVQPMVARMTLPRLGGAPAVWNSAMLVYQALLLAGYAYAHWLGRFAPRLQGGIHVAAFAIAALTLPLGLAAAVPPADANPFIWVPWLLLVSIGPLFLVVSAQAPLIQRWFALSGGGDPYPLYAASNLGSFAGLLAYPLLVEPLMSVSAQRWLWSGAYVLLALLVVWCAIQLPKLGPTESQPKPIEKPHWRTIAMWILLSAVPSGLILSTTLHLTTDIVAVPLLWVVPLSLYLLSFTVAFATNRRAAELFTRVAPITLLVAACGAAVDVSSFALVFAAASVVSLFAVSVALHSDLFERRPEPRQLTLFYLAMSVGGVLGGIFCALVAPMIFDWTYEYLILLVAAAYLLSSPPLFRATEKLWNGTKRATRLTWLGIAIVFLISLLGQSMFGMRPSESLALAASYAIIAIGILAIGNRLLLAACITALLLSMGGWEKLQLSASPGSMTRSFFGVYSIRSADFEGKMLVHGTTIHGIQNLGSPERERMATSYYAPSSGIGLAMMAVPALFGENARIDVVGLGAGTLACYALPGQHWTYYEIDPVVASIARDPRRFTFLSRCLPNARIVIGDARLTLDKEPASSADILVVDAFSSDSVPMHLLTREAFDGYGRIVGTRGLLLVHISNRYLDLRPVIAAAGAAGGWHLRMLNFGPTPEQESLNYNASLWIAMSRSPGTMEHLAGASNGRWQEVKPRPGFAVWTDDHASLLPLIQWNN